MFSDFPLEIAIDFGWPQAGLTCALTMAMSEYTDSLLTHLLCLLDKHAYVVVSHFHSIVGLIHSNFDYNI